MSCGPLGIVPLHAHWLTAKHDNESPTQPRFTYAQTIGHVAHTARRTSRGGERMVSIGLNGLHRDREDLRCAEDEAAAVARLYPDSALLVGPDVTPERIRNSLVDAALVHLATHGTFSVGDPTSGGIYLSGGKFLSFSELIKFGLGGVRLITSSACWSGLHETFYLPDEIDGPTSAMVDAGVRAVVAPAWDIADFEAALLMTKLHLLLSDGATAARAATGAQAWLRDASHAEQDDFAQLHEIRLPAIRVAPHLADTWASLRYIGADLALRRTTQDDAI